MMKLIGEWISDMGGQFGKDDGSVRVVADVGCPALFQCARLPGD